MNKLTKLFRPVYCRQYCSATFSHDTIDWDYFRNPENLSSIADNIYSRKISSDLIDVVKTLREFHSVENDTEKLNSLKNSLLPDLIWFPNTIHPRVLKNKSEEPTVVKKVGSKPAFSYFPTNFEHLTKRLNALRTKHLGHMAGNKSYYLKGDLALLEQALIRFAVSKLTQKKFELLYVPDILPKSFIEGCGMKTKSKHSQVNFMKCMDLRYGSFGVFHTWQSKS